MTVQVSPEGQKSKAQVAELVDAQVSGTCGRKAVEVRVFSWAPFPSVENWVRRAFQQGRDTLAWIENCQN